MRIPLKQAKKLAIVLTNTSVKNLKFITNTGELLKFALPKGWSTKLDCTGAREIYSNNKQNLFIMRSSYALNLESMTEYKYQKRTRLLPSKYKIYKISDNYIVESNVKDAFSVDIWDSDFKNRAEITTPGCTEECAALRHEIAKSLVFIPMSQDTKLLNIVCDEVLK